MTKQQKSALLAGLAIIVLLAIGAILVMSILKNRSKNEDKNKKDSTVLGETTTIEATPTPFVDVNQLLQSTYQTTKDTVSQKVVEVQKTITADIEKEITNLTQSQVETLKLQICRDWGVVTIVPTKSP
jgi:hypothetical protein